MTDKEFNQIYQAIWTQEYVTWQRIDPETREPVEDLTQAREVLARIMAK